MRHRGYEVWVTSDGEPLAEYQSKVEGEDGKNMACFTPSESGKASVQSLSVPFQMMLAECTPTATRPSAHSLNPHVRTL